MNLECSPGSDREISVEADVSRADDVRPMIDTALNAFGRLDVLCDEAGIGGGTRARLADVDEATFDQQIAAAALFLASHHASFLTGTAIPLDGGYVAR